jgi:hypothetical protein
MVRQAVLGTTDTEQCSVVWFVNSRCEELKDVKDARLRSNNTVPDGVARI